MADRTYTNKDLSMANIQKNDVMLAVIQNDIKYIKDELRDVHQDISTGYAPLSELNALKDKVALMWRALAFLLGTLTVALVSYVFSLLK